VVGSWTAGALLAAAPSNKPANRADHSIQRINVPVRIYGGFLVVAEGQIGSKFPRQNFILDTGTSPSILNARIAHELGLPLAPARLAAIGQESQIHSTILPRLELGALHLNSAQFLVADLSEVERTWKVPIAGILGLDVLGRVSFRLDFQNQLLEFGDVAPDGIPVDLSGAGHLPIAEVNINGRPLRLLVDTGSDCLVFFGKKLAAGVASGADSALLTASSVSGAVPVQELSSLEFEWKGERFHQKAVVVPDRQEPWFDGLMSVRSLGFRSLAMDAASQTVYLLK
jgi:predicted aspartyl protease